MEFIEVSTTMDKMHDCPVLATIKVMGGKWKPRILWRLREGPATFGDLRRVVGVSEKVLHENLRALTRDGLISRTPSRVGEVVYVEYRYTEYGLSLVPALDAMGEWGLVHGANADRQASPGAQTG
ncbi:winged helix-turn-helix transcriptional regulator [Rhizobium herbae]